MDLYAHPIPRWISQKRWHEEIKYRPWRIRAIIRDKYQCVDCGVGNVKLLVHHIDESYGANVNNKLNNLVTVCSKCHAKRHGRGFNKNPIIEKLKELAVDNKIRMGTLSMIGNALGVSRERVRQVAKQLGYTMPHRVSALERIHKCEACGKPFPSRTNRKCCSPECYKIYYYKKYWTTKPCKNCGGTMTFRKALKNIGREPVFCNNRCRGLYLAKTVGFLAHPENAGRAGNEKLPADKEMIRKLLPDKFVISQVCKKFQYSYIGAYLRLETLVLRGLLIKEKNKKGQGRANILSSG